MSLQLPPERTLAEPDLIVDRILADAVAAGDDRPTRTHRGLIAGVSVAAGFVLAATAIGVAASRHDKPEVAAPPLTTASPSAPTRISVPLGTKVTLPHLDVTVESAGSLTVNQARIDEYTITVQTCVRSLPADAKNHQIRLPEDSWVLNTTAGRITTADPIKSPVPLPAPPASNGSYRVGECTSGVIGFGVAHDVAVQTIDYSNAFGDLASWKTS